MNQPNPPQAVAQLCEAIKDDNQHTFDALARHAAATLSRIRAAIAADRCDGDSEYAQGVNAACQNHLTLIDAVIAASGVQPSSNDQKGGA